MLEPVYRYRARCVRVIDGDTFEMDIDLGLRVHAVVMVRLYGWSAHEKNTLAGMAARLAAMEVLTPTQPPHLLLETYKDQQTFGRWLADVYVNGIALHELMGVHLFVGSKMGVVAK